MRLSINQEIRNDEFWEDIPTAYFLVDTSWQIIDVNRDCEQELNTGREELVGKSLWILFPQTEDLAHTQDSIRAVPAPAMQKATYIQYCPMLEKWFKIFIYPVPDGLAIYFHILTSEERLATKAGSSHLQLLPMVHTIEDMIWSVDKELKLLSGNESFFRAVKIITGREVEKGNEVFLFREEVSRSHAWRKYYERALKGENFRIVDHSSTLYGKEWYTETSFSPILFHGEVTGVTCVARDITENKRNERLIREQNRLLRQIAMMQVHELRKPLASILGLMSLFDKDRFSSDFNRIIIDKVEILCTELDKIIHKIVDKASDGS